jgi:hypothetical protein
MVLLENKSVVFIHDRFGPKVSLGTLRLPQESMVGRLRRQRLHFSQNGSEGSESGRSSAGPRRRWFYPSLLRFHSLRQIAGTGSGARHDSAAWRRWRH